MPRSFLFASILAFALSCGGQALAAQRSFVSTSGSDANTASNCSNTAPCRGFAAALTVTNAGGEIIVLESGGYGPVAIDKSVSIIAPDGVYAGISAVSGNGITIATAGVHVVLRGLTINWLAGGNNGIAMTNGANLSIENCVVSNFAGGLYAGLLVDTAAEVNVVDSLFQGNYYGAMIRGGATVRLSDSRFLRNTWRGVSVSSNSAGTTTVSAERTVSSGNGQAGYYADASTGSVHLVVTNSLASDNTSYGLTAMSTGSGLVDASLSGSLISHNGIMGVWAYGSGTRLTISRNTITRNGDYGIYQAGSATFRSAGDNSVTENQTGASSGTITPLTQM